MKIQSHFNTIGKFKSDWSQEEIKNEPMLFNCDFDHALKLGGPITKEFLIGLQILGCTRNLVIDSRVHMLMKGWYPCIPGFHHDDVPRSTVSGQPNYINPEYRSKHIMGLVNGDICPTQFAIGHIDLDIPEGIIYKHWHKEVSSAIDLGTMSTVNAESGKFIHFDDRTFHQGVAAVDSGWRWFIRVSYDTNRTKHCTNELRRQVQVYLEHPMEGW